MKKRILVVSFALALSANLHAQVTIGELAEPAKGAILDLNKAVKGGLALSNVDLPDFHTIPATFPGMNPVPSNMDAVKTGFIGALVYNTGLTSPPAGIYVWNGTNWTPVKENCTPRTLTSLTLTGLPFAKVGDDVTFLVSSGASAFCSQNESYEWYKTGANDNNYTPVSETASSLTTSFSPVGTYKVKVIVTNRYTAAPIEKIATVEITNDGIPPITLVDASYGITGDFCYDVKGPKPASQSQATYDSRTNAFAGGALTKTYTFTYTNDFSNLTVLNPGDIVASVSQPAVTSGSGSGSVSFSVTFVSDVKDRVIANNGPVQVQLVVSFKNNTGIDKVAYKNIKVQDDFCGCPAQVPVAIHPSGWLTFQCHNLGADYDIRSDAELMNINATNFREYHGDWYRFGAKNAAIENTLAHDSYSYLTNTDYQETTEDDTSQKDAEGNNLWKAANNPCPSGWRLPTDAEWKAVISTSNNAYKHYVDGVATTSGWVVGSINSVLKIGDYLYLPAAGCRNSDPVGPLERRGEGGYYWSGSSEDLISYNQGRYIGFSNGYPVARYVTRLAGYSVRCVSVE